MELVGSRFCDVVHLGGAVASLIHRVGERVDRHLRNGVKAQHQIGGEAAVEVGQGIVGFQSVDDVSVRKRRKSIEFDISITVRSADEIVAAAGSINQRPRRELERICQVAAGVGQIFQGSGVQCRRGVGILRVQEGGFGVHRHIGAYRGNAEREVYSLCVPQTRHNADFSLQPELRRGCLHGIASRPELREGEPPRLIRLHAPFLAVFFAERGDIHTWYSGPGLVGYQARDGAGGFPLCG